MPIEHTMERADNALLVCGGWRGTAEGSGEEGVKLVFVKAEIEGVRKNEGRKT